MSNWSYGLFIFLQLMGVIFFTYTFCRNHATTNDRFVLCVLTGCILICELFRIIQKLQGVDYPITPARLFVWRYEHFVFGAFWWEVFQHVRKAVRKTRNP